MITEKKHLSQKRFAGLGSKFTCNTKVIAGSTN